VFTQMVRPGTPMIYSTLSTVADMRSGAYASGGIECGMLNMAHAQMARFYRVPCAGYIGLTNSKLVDAQAGYEKALACLGGLLAGMHVLQFAGLIEALLTFDFGMAVVDNEISLMLKRVARGLEISETNLGLDEIKTFAPSGMFIDSDLTRENMKVTALLPEIADRQTRESWSKKGGLDTADRALLKARKRSRPGFDAVSKALLPAITNCLRAGGRLAVGQPARHMAPLRDKKAEGRLWVAREIVRPKYLYHTTHNDTQGKL
jgi:trimethylamine---corrinoid protein Co-methyltransferase